MNINFLIKFINLILLLILIKSLKKCYFVYITIPFQCVYLYNKLFTVLKKKIFFFINIILYSLLNIYINFQLFIGKFFNLLRFCFDIYQQNILNFFLFMKFYRLITNINQKKKDVNKKNLINVIPFILLLIVITSLKFYYYMLYILFNLICCVLILNKMFKVLKPFYFFFFFYNLTVINVKLLKIFNKFTTLFAMIIDFLDIQILFLIYIIKKIYSKLCIV